MVPRCRIPSPSHHRHLIQLEKHDGSSGALAKASLSFPVFFFNQTRTRGGRERNEERLKVGLRIHVMASLSPVVSKWIDELDVATNVLTWLVL